MTLSAFSGGTVPFVLTRHLVFFLQEPLLGEELFTNTHAALPSSPTLSLTFSAQFPCLGDELEEQVKALEEDW